MKYTQIPSDTFQKIQMNAGMLVDDFTPATGEIGNIVGATSGGFNFSDIPSFKDFGEDIDNCPKNTKELKQIENREIKVAGSFVTIDAESARLLMATADTDGGHIVPRDDVLEKDFKEMWFIGDYSDVNTGENAGFLAIHVMNALSTDGFQIQTADKGKGTFSFGFTAHYSIKEQTVVPYEVYIKQGEETVVPSILFDKHLITVKEGSTATINATTVPSGETITWTSGSDLIAEVSDGVVTGIDAGNTIITGAITVDGVTYNDTCTVVVEEVE